MVSSWSDNKPHRVRLTTGSTRALATLNVNFTDRGAEPGDLDMYNGNLYIEVDGVEVCSLWFTEREGHLAVAFGGWEGLRKEDGSPYCDDDEENGEWIEIGHITLNSEGTRRALEREREREKRMGVDEAIESIANTYRESA